MNDETRRPVEDASIRVLRLGHGANCSSIGSVVDTLFVTSLLGGALFASIVAAFVTEPIEVIGEKSEPRSLPLPSANEDASS